MNNMDTENENGDNKNSKTTRRQHTFSSSSDDLFEVDVHHTKQDSTEQHRPISSPGKPPLGGSSTQPYETLMNSHPAGYDPSRIPASIFCSKPNNGMDWSVASNESLFSIQMGNASFRDHPMMLYKSGELPKLDEVNKLNNPDEPPIHVQPCLATVTEEEHVDRKPEEDTRKSSVSEVSADTTEPVTVETAEQLSQEKARPAPDVRRYSHSEEGSLNSVQSFAFPILEGGNKPTMTDSEKQQPSANHSKEQQSSSAAKASQEQSQPQIVARTAHKSAGYNWFYCFHCFAQCCYVR